MLVVTFICKYISASSIIEMFSSFTGLCCEMGERVGDTGQLSDNKVLSYCGSNTHLRVTTKLEFSKFK